MCELNPSTRFSFHNTHKVMSDPGQVPEVFTEAFTAEASRTGTKSFSTTTQQFRDPELHSGNNSCSNILTQRLS